MPAHLPTALPSQDSTSLPSFCLLFPKTTALGVFMAVLLEEGLG